MWKAFVQVCFLLGTVKELNGVEGGKKILSALKSGGLATKFVNMHETPASSRTFLGNLLVIPMDGSHWVDIKAVAQELGRRGHGVTVLMPEVSLRLGPGEHYTTLTYPVPYGQAEVDALLGGNAEAMNKPFMEKMKRISHMASVIHDTAHSLLFNTTLMSYLSKQGFDAVLTNPMLPTGSLIARKLGLPTINLLRGMPCGMEMKSSASPSPPSYVPRFYTGFTDKMNFKQRFINTLISFLEPLLCRVMYWNFDQLAVEFLGEEIGIAEILKDSAIWLIRTDFTLDHPRPLMPNVVLVGGMNCDLRNPLPEDLQTWVSGADGFVVFTLGAMVASLPQEITAVFLEAFRQIPQKVVWRWVGEVPDNVPENVKMMKWVPQNDLLAHPGVRAFITHAGSHGLYEGVCHAVPMMMLPISAEQPDNANRMASRGVGVVLDIQTITVEKLLQGLSDVIHNTRYKENIEKLSILHKDRPIPSFDLSLYWIEFVMRHKGADHLRTAAHQLNWFQYHSLDVITILSLVAMVVLTVTLTCMRWCLSRLLRKRKRD